MRTDLALLMLLSKITAPRNYRPDLERLFKCDRTRIARFVYQAMVAIHEAFKYTLVMDIDRLKLRRNRRAFARAIARRIGAVNPQAFLCIGFIDCTFRHHARPSIK